MPQTAPFSPLEARILGVLVEKKLTVPDTYPLTLNALTAGCNQKTSRDPVMNATEAEVLAALETLRARTLIVESSGSRASRYAHNMEKGLQLPSQSVALLVTLMLRGPQTVAELRANSERLHRFLDSSAVEGFLDELANRPDDPYVVQLPKAPGSRESRWAHLLCGEPELPVAAPAAARADGGELATLREDVARLQDEVTELRAALARVYTELGLQ
ncbi:YceH family protein [Chitiniphilus shinanonensis]|uniref:YceH family protein n=1 Tax=Chitiniphilus shinanonensis TaxID=553088 RepID=UPI003075581B